MLQKQRLNNGGKVFCLMDKAYIIHRLSAIKRIILKEIKRGTKIYFWDKGILNAIIGNFNPFSARADKGAL